MTASRGTAATGIVKPDGRALGLRASRDACFQNRRKWRRVFDLALAGRSLTGESGNGCVE